MKTSRMLYLLFAVITAVLIADNVVATNCTDDEYDTIMEAGAEYGKSLGAACVPGMCSADCVAAMTKLADQLPDCDVVAGIRHEMLADGLSWCSNSSSSDSSSSSSNHTCSPAEKAVTLTVYYAYDEEFTSACLEGTCSAGCLAVGSSMVAEFPDCYYPEFDGNFVVSINAAADTCKALNGSNYPASTDGSDGSESSSSLVVEAAGSSGAEVVSVSMIAVIGLFTTASVLV